MVMEMMKAALAAAGYEVVEMAARVDSFGNRVSLDELLVKDSTGSRWQVTIAPLGVPDPHARVDQWERERRVRMGDTTPPTDAQAAREAAGQAEWQQKEKERRDAA